MTSTWITPVQVAERKRSPVATVLASVGLVMTLAGLVFGLMPIHLLGASCGSPFNRSTVVSADEMRRVIVSEACDTARSDRGSLALALLIPGSLLALGGGGSVLMSKLYSS